MPNSVIALIVKNHPGVMARITGLFARRAYNLEGILCGPTRDASKSRIYLLVNMEKRLQQVIRNLEKLYDVYDISIQEAFDQSLFSRLHELGIIPNDGNNDEFKKNMEKGKSAHQGRAF
ncbi:MAG: acetolactate synthase small subunit [Desulfobacterales bacterium]|nr:acetolactate synthase small subunit [Desulfobacterales bacterium]